MVAPWLCSTPFGSAVDPEVYISIMGSAGATSASMRAAISPKGAGGSASRPDPYSPRAQAAGESSQKKTPRSWGRLGR